MNSNVAASLILLGLVSCSSAPGRAYTCGGVQVVVWPPSGSVPTNGVWVIEAENGLISRLDAGEAVLESKSGNVALIPERRVVGHNEAAQVVLRPAKPLIAGASYVLAWIGGPLPDPEAGWKKPLTWTAGQVEDVTPPKEVVVRKFTQHGYTLEGERLVEFEVEADESPFFVVAAVGTNPWSTAERETVILLPRHGMVRLYRGVCGGNAGIPLHGRFFADIVAVDLAGNHSLAQEALMVPEKK